MKALLYVHGGSGNHGCEALARTISAYLHKRGCECSALTANISEDKIAGLDKSVNLIPLHNHVKRFSVSFIHAYLMNSLFGKYIYLDMLPRKKQIDSLSGFDTAIAIGGDTYSYGYSDANTYMHDLFRQKGMKTLLWGCSIDPILLEDPRIISDLQKFDKITARESITYNALKNKGINNVFLYPDMAFTLPCQQNSQSDKIDDGKTIGLNLSPLIMKYQNKDMILNNYRELIDYIIKETNNNIALIPHVVWASSDDRTVLQLLYDVYKYTGRVFLINDCNCMQLKDIISKLKILVCARTHASIAAYSTYVPTLVLGYSVKARGIAKDIFGTEDRFVLPVQSLKDDQDLLNAFKWIEKNAKSLRNHLSRTIPKYINNIEKANDVL